MNHNLITAEFWLNYLPEQYADYLSFSIIDLGRHPSAFLTYKDKIRFIKQVPEHVQQKEYAVLSWLEQLQSKTETLTSERLEKAQPPLELQLPQPEFIHSRTDLLVTSKLDGFHLTKLSLLEQLPLVCKVLVYIHRLIEVTHLPNIIVQSLNYELPCDINDVAPAYKNVFQQAKDNIKNNVAILSFIHGDLSDGNILASDLTIGLVDWEYATVRDGRWDLATLAVEFELNAKEFSGLCEVYLKQRDLQEKSFTSVAQSWSVIYALTCLSWAQKNNQETNRYIRFLQNLEY